jgi:hypothetical protein
MTIIKTVESTKFLIESIDNGNSYKVLMESNDGAVSYLQEVKAWMESMNINNKMYLIVNKKDLANYGIVR